MIIVSYSILLFAFIKTILLKKLKLFSNKIYFEKIMSDWYVKKT